MAGRTDDLTVYFNHCDGREVVGDGLLQSIAGGGDPRVDVGLVCDMKCACRVVEKTGGGLDAVLLGDVRVYTCGDHGCPPWQTLVVATWVGGWIQDVVPARPGAFGHAALL